MATYINLISTPIPGGSNVVGKGEAIAGLQTNFGTIHEVSGDIIVFPAGSGNRYSWEVYAYSGHFAGLYGFPSVSGIQYGHEALYPPPGGVPDAIANSGVALYNNTFLKYP